MPTRLQIILISAIALMAALGFAATQLMNGRLVNRPFIDQEMQEDQEGATESAMAQALRLLPPSESVVAAAPMSDTRFWVVTDHARSEGHVWHTWSINAEQGEAILLKERNAPPPHSYSWEIIPTDPNSGNFIVRLESAWESPLRQTRDIIRAETGELLVSMEWSGAGSLLIEKDQTRLDIRWHVMDEACVSSGDPFFINDHARVDGLQINDTFLPFSQSFGPVSISCTFNDLGGVAEYQPLGEPSLIQRPSDQALIQFDVVQDRYRSDVQIVASVDLARLRPEAVEFEYLR